MGFIRPSLEQIFIRYNRFHQACYIIRKKKTFDIPNGISPQRHRTPDLPSPSLFVSIVQGREYPLSEVYFHPAPVYDDFAVITHIKKAWCLKPQSDMVLSFIFHNLWAIRSIIKAAVHEKSFSPNPLPESGS